jgi:hypothetical protein
MSGLSRLLLTAVFSGALPVAAMSDVVLSSNDGHTVMNAQKAMVAPSPASPDTITVIDVKSYPPTIKATFEAPGSVVGPPGAIWISKDESWGIVTRPPRRIPRRRMAASRPMIGWRCSI